jgi:hypothetical protein
MFIPTTEANILNVTIGMRIRPLEDNILERVFPITNADEAIVDTDPITLKRVGTAETNPCGINNSFTVDFNSEASIPMTPQYDCVVRTAISFVVVPLASHILPKNQCDIVAGKCIESHTSPTCFLEF